MGSAQRKDWEESTRIDADPVSHFGPEVSGERRTMVELPGLFDDDEGKPDDAATRIRDVPSALIRAAATGENPVVDVSALEKTIDLEATTEDPNFTAPTPLVVVNIPSFAPPVSTRAPVSTVRPVPNAQPTVRPTAAPEPRGSSAFGWVMVGVAAGLATFAVVVAILAYQGLI
jgi:hypothetical protein